MVQILKTLFSESDEGQGMEHIKLTEELRGHLPHVPQLPRHPQNLVLDVEKRVALVKKERVPPV